MRMKNAVCLMPAGEGCRKTYTVPQIIAKALMKPESSLRAGPFGGSGSVGLQDAVESHIRTFGKRKNPKSNLVT